MVTAINPTSHSAGFSTEIKRNNPTHTVINANISLNNNALNNDISSILPPELTVLLPEIIEYDLIDYNQDNTLKKNERRIFLP